MEYVPPIGGDPNDPYIDANPALGVEGSPVPAAAIEHPMREIMNVITGGGIVPAGGVHTQLLAAIQELITASLAPDASETVKGIIEIATAAEAQALVDDLRALTPAKLAAALDVTALGRNQTWQNVTGSRATNVTYTNSTGRPIQVSVTALTDGTTGNGLSFSVNGVEIIFEGVVTLINRYSTMLIIPPGATYLVTGKPGTAIEKWFELRN